MKTTIEYSDFDKLELRIGRVIEALAPAWSRKLLEFTVDFGPEIGQKKILSGVSGFYTPADFLHKNFPFVINMAERKMGEGISQGMMLMADAEVDGAASGELRPVILPVDQAFKPGTLLR